MVGESPVKRYIRSELAGFKITIDVQVKGWNFDITLDSNWVRTPSGIGDYLQTFSLDYTAGLECQVYLSPRWGG